MNSLPSASGGKQSDKIQAVLKQTTDQEPAPAPFRGVVFDLLQPELQNTRKHHSR
jgi:hypothetical protein